MPPKLRVVEVSACANASKITARLSAGNADAGVARPRSAVPPRVRRATRAPRGTTTSPRSVNLIALPTRFVRTCRGGPDRRRDGRARRTARGRPAPGLSAGREPPASSSGPRPCRAARTAIRSSSQLARFDLREIEDVVDDRRAAPGPDCAMVSTYSRCSAVELRVEREVGHADDRVHRRADLVAHVGQEIGFGLASPLPPSPWRRRARAPAA